MTAYLALYLAAPLAVSLAARLFAPGIVVWWEGRHG